MGAVRNIPTIAELRKGLTQNQKKLIEDVWRYYFEKLEWPTTRSIYSRYGKPIVREALNPLSGNVITEDHNINGQSRFVLTLLGILLTEHGVEFQELFSRFFEMQREIFRKSPDKMSIGSNEIGETLGLSSTELRTLGVLIRLAHLSGGYGLGNDPAWAVSTMAEAEDFPSGEKLANWVERWALRFYRPGLPVFSDDRVHFATAVAGDESAIGTTKTARGDSASDVGNPLKKRYQVFVSSTYEDLIEERKHVMQALLATKCIPSGMELFPAASTEQWNLIKSVIDDCDYYVVVIAGKYGSIGPTGKSYTEMEFDHAVKQKKSILGFYYSDLQTLPGKRLEQNEQRRNQLRDFTQKVKSRMCQAWNSPEGLASALKTAIYHAIEADPKSGWVRASEVPTWNMISNLEERISELEGRKAPKNNTAIPAPNKDLFEFAATIIWYETDNPQSYYGERERFSADFDINMTWDDLLLCFPLKAGKSITESGLKKRFLSELAKRNKGSVQKQSNRLAVVNITAKIEANEFDNIFQTFVARGYFAAISQNAGSYDNPSRKRKVLWKLTQKGIRKFAEAKTANLNKGAS